MSVRYVVGISDRKVASAPDTLVTYALGSCVGVALYDEDAGVGGLAHIMLPSSSIEDGDVHCTKMKYADTAIDDMVAEMLALGAHVHRMKAKLAGGANMFSLEEESLINCIGGKNITAAKEALTKLSIALISEDVGDHYGRTMLFDLSNGKVEIRTLGKGVKEI